MYRVNQIKLFVEENPKLFLSNAEKVVNKAQEIAEEEMITSVQAETLLGPKAYQLLVSRASSIEYIRAAIEPVVAREPEETFFPGQDMF